MKKGIQFNRKEFLLKENFLIKCGMGFSSGELHPEIVTSG